MGREAGDYHDQQDPFDLIGVVCPECGEYWEEPGAGWTQCPMCNHEFEVDDEVTSSTADDDDFISPEPDPLESREFAPLIETAGPLIYRNNGFRVTGLPVDASERNIKDFERLAKVGRAASMKGGLLPLTPDENAIQSAIERLKDSDLRLVDEFFWFWPPEWNQPIEDGLLAALGRRDIDGAASILMRQTTRDQHKKAATHNLAVLYHAAALDLEFDSELRQLSDEDLKKRDVYWMRAFRYWQTLIDHDGFWNHFSSRIAQLEDPRFTAGQIRKSLPLALALIVAKLALASAKTDNSTETARYIDLILNSGVGQQNISEALARVARPLRDRIKALCDAAKKESESDPAKVDRIVDNLLKQSLEPLGVMRRLLNQDMLSGARLLENACDEVASFINNELPGFANRTGEWGVCARYFEKALSIAVSPFLREQIAEALGALRQNAGLKDLIEEIDKVFKSSLSPEAKYGMLSKISRRRLALIKQELGEASGAYVAACNMLASAIRGVAVELHNAAKQYQLAVEAATQALGLCRDPGLREQLTSELSEITKHAELEKVTANLKPISSAPTLRSVNGVGTTLYGRSDYDRNTNSYLTTLYFIILFIPIFPISRYRVIDLSGNSYQFLGKVPLRRGDAIHRLVALCLAGWAAISIWVFSDQGRSPGVTRTSNSGTYGYSQQPGTNNNGVQPSYPKFPTPTPALPEFRAPAPVNDQIFNNQSSYETEQLSNEIESAKEQLRQLESEIEPIETQLNSLKEQIDSNAAAIRGYESSINLGYEVNRDDYRNTIARHNSLVEEHNQLLAEYRSIAARHKALVRETNEKVNRYNNLIRGQ